MKQEPKLGNLFGLISQEEVKLDHVALVDDALSAFTKAEEQMEAAIAKIGDEIAREAEAVLEAERRKQNAIDSHSRLSRVLNRVKEFTK